MVKTFVLWYIFHAGWGLGGMYMTPGGFSTSLFYGTLEECNRAGAEITEVYHSVGWECLPPGKEPSGGRSKHKHED